MKIYKNYIWDFDGTLYDSYPVLTYYAIEMFRHYNINASDKEIEDYLKVSFSTLAKRFSLTEEQMNYVRELKANDEHFLDKVKPFKEIFEVLKKIHKAGGRNFLFTHSDKEHSVSLLERDGIDKLFDGYVTSDMQLKPKPSPDGINYICRTYDLDKSETVMVGDRMIDVNSGINAKVDTILFDSENRVKDKGYTFKITNLSSIAQPFDELNLSNTK